LMACSGAAGLRARGHGVRGGGGMTAAGIGQEGHDCCRHWPGGACVLPALARRGMTAAGIGQEGHDCCRHWPGGA
jgi:hypothetical protein